jgi:hypothetical protein
MKSLTLWGSITHSHIHTFTHSHINNNTRRAEDIDVFSVLIILPFIIGRAPLVAQITYLTHRSSPTVSGAAVCWAAVRTSTRAWHHQAPQGPARTGDLLPFDTARKNPSGLGPQSCNRKR